MVLPLLRGMAVFISGSGLRILFGVDLSMNFERAGFIAA
jgi:hypothetical protein